MKIITKLEITETRPEEMRVIADGPCFLVQTLSRRGIWVTQKKHETESAAVADCLDWY